MMRLFLFILFFRSHYHSFFFKAATIPPFKEEYDEFLQYVDVLKMHGRDSFNRINETISIIKNYASNHEILQDDNKAYLDGVTHEELKSWRRKIICKRRSSRF
jgi:hypothetical protein